MRFPHVFDGNFIITLSLVTSSLSTSVILLFLIHEDFLIEYEKEKERVIQNLLSVTYQLLMRDYFVFSGDSMLITKLFCFYLVTILNGLTITQNCNKTQCFPDKSLLDKQKTHINYDLKINFIFGTLHFDDIRKLLR